MSDFTLHSIGIILSRLGQIGVLLRLVDDVFVQGGVALVSVQPETMHRVITAMGQFNLDFDDAYQYVAAELSNAVVVSFDGAFDRTARGRQTHLDVL